MDASELIEQIDIVEYIGQYTELEQRGEEFWGLSVFKSEHTPSFSVRPETQTWYDFSSGQGGDIISFVRAYHRVSFSKAVEMLKEFAGIDGEVAESKYKRLAATSVARRFAEPKAIINKQSTATVLADDYMKKYVEDSPFLDLWRDEGITDEALQAFQVRYDPFASRIVYPIRDVAGKIVNVGGRTVDPRWKALNLRKYCYYFNWGTLNTIYGVAENREEIVAKKEIILFEGCKSVLMAYSMGIKNCGAILTSHLNLSQVKILVKLGCHVVFALDKDIDIRQDKNIMKLRQFLPVSYLKDTEGLLDEKDSPVDKGKEIFLQLYQNKRAL